jgi:hypothetical protein
MNDNTLLIWFSLSVASLGIVILVKRGRRSHRALASVVRSDLDVDQFRLEIKPLDITPEQVQSYADRKWRPFRWPYHQTMSIFKLDINHWLDMDKYYWRYIEESQRMFQEHPDETIGWLSPESDDACAELVETVAHHLAQRYPKCFHLTSTGIDNLLTGQHISLTKPYKEHPLRLCSRLAKEDFYVVQQRSDGRHYLVAAAVPFPGGSFTIKEKLGEHLDVIHGEVPYYSEKLQSSMERWFGRLKVNEPVERATFNIAWDHGLYDTKLHNIPRGAELNEEPPFEKFNVRIERQALRRLPRSRAIIFSNHPLFYSIDEMKDERMVPSLLRTIINEGPEKIVEYKQFDAVRNYLTPYLDRLIDRQIQLGIITADESVRTLPTYPFAESPPKCQHI